MDVTKKFLYLISTLLYCAKGVFAQTLEVGKSKFKTVFNLYHQNSNDGAQVYDNSGREETNVVEPMFFFQHQVDESTNINVQFVLDFWTAASDTKLDAQTGASGDEGIKGQSRVSSRIGIQREKAEWSYGGGLGYSSEYDYRSLNGSFNIAKSFAQKNFTLGLGVQYYKDQVDLFTDLSTPSTVKIETGLDRTIVATSLTATQLLTTRDIIQFGLNYVKASGYLESTASSVLVAGNRESEQLPETRDRYAFSTKWVHGLNDISSIHTSYRYYSDDWAVKAHTFNLSYYLEVDEEDEDYIEFFLRGHFQNKTEYFSTNYSASKEFMTSDSDLDEFHSSEVGAFYSNNVGDRNWFGLSFENVEWGNGIVILSRSNGMRYSYIQTSLGVQF